VLEFAVFRACPGWSIASDGTRISDAVYGDLQYRRFALRSCHLSDTSVAGYTYVPVPGFNPIGGSVKSPLFHGYWRLAVSSRHLLGRWPLTAGSDLERMARKLVRGWHMEFC
jgi:hypothetical protein